jgi:hypothetical protein
MTFELIEFNQAADDFKKLIAKQKAELQKYALKPDHNARAVELKQQALNEMYLFLKSAETIVQTLDQDKKSQFLKGFKAGERKTQQGHNHRRTIPKETARHNSTERAAKMWPELY